MTNLELMICEAENAGEIDLDTRDMMLGILNESTLKAEPVDGPRRMSIEEYKKYMSQHEENIKKRKNQSNQRGSGQSYDAEILDDITGNLIKKKHKADEAAKVREEINKTRLLSKKKRNALLTRIYDIEKDLEDAKAEYKVRYKTTNGLKESVLEEIYEAELCGDITPEERMALIDYMDM